MIASIGLGKEKSINVPLSTWPMFYGGYYEWGTNTSAILTNNKTASFISTENGNKILIDTTSVYYTLGNDSVTLGGRLHSLQSPLGVVLPNTQTYYSASFTAEHIWNIWEVEYTYTINNHDQIYTSTNVAAESTSGYYVSYTPNKNSATMVTVVLAIAPFLAIERFIPQAEPALQRLYCIVTTGC